LELNGGASEESISTIGAEKNAYRPFDNKYIYYVPSLIDRDRRDSYATFSEWQEFRDCLGRQTKNKAANHFFITKYIIEKKICRVKYTVLLCTTLPVF